MAPTATGQGGDLRIGLVGYGLGGRRFHAPFIDAADGCRLAAIVARAPDRVAAARQDWPDVPVFASLNDLAASGLCDAVTVTTPPHTRVDLVLAAIAAGLHVIADKPFAPDVALALRLRDAARQQGVTLGAYHNRRYDSDFQTLLRLVRDGRLGRIWRIHSRMDQDGADTIEAGPSGGLLRDLGSHVVDQALHLLGPAIAVDAQMDFADLPGGRTDVGFTITLRHQGGAHSHLSASKLNGIDARELRAYGDAGGYVVSSTDVQAQASIGGARPADDLAAWGFEPRSHWGRLSGRAGGQDVPPEQGRYHDYYRDFAAAVRAVTPPPVTPDQAIQTLAVLDAARDSAATGRSVSLTHLNSEEESLLTC